MTNDGDIPGRQHDPIRMTTFSLPHPLHRLLMRSYTAFFPRYCGHPKMWFEIFGAFGNQISLARNRCHSQQVNNTEMVDYPAGHVTRDWYLQMWATNFSKII